MPKLRCVDLFCGSGGFTHSFKGLGAECVFANDFDPISKKCFDANNEGNQVFMLGDLTKIDLNQIPDHDILTAGFPCQPYSIAGKRLGFDDSRGDIFWKVVEILKVHKPSCFLLENVKNLLTHDAGETFRKIIDTLSSIGYFIKYTVVDTCKVTGIPQHRERVYIIGFMDERHFDKFEFDFLRIEPMPIMQYLESVIDPKYYYDDRFKVYPMISEAVTKHIETNTMYNYRGSHVRELKGGVCPTLRSAMGAGGHNTPLLLDNKGIRKLTPRECFNLQGFPADYVIPSEVCDGRLYKIIGNAISIPIVTHIAKLITKQLGGR